MSERESLIAAPSKTPWDCQCCRLGGITNSSHFDRCDRYGDIAPWLFASADQSRLPNSRELRDYTDCMVEIASRSDQNDAANIIQVTAWLNLAMARRAA